MTTKIVHFFFIFLLLDPEFGSTKLLNPDPMQIRILKETTVKLTKISPERTSSSERRLCPSRRSSNRSRTLRPAYK
jgi:hypothetical protein